MATHINATGASWGDYNLDVAMGNSADSIEFRNERPSGFGDDEGEWFSIVEHHATPHGTFHVIFDGTHGNDHSPMSSHHTGATLYNVADPTDMVEFARDVADWVSRPETDPDCPDDYDDDSDPDDDDDSVPIGWESVEGGGWTPGLRPSIPLHDMGLAELRAFADTLGIDGPRSAIPEDVRNTLYRWAMLSADSVCYAKQGLKDVYARIAAECDRLYDQLPDRYRW